MNLEEKNSRVKEGVHCIADVQPEDVWAEPYQCSRKRGYGKNGLYCKQHAKRYPEVPDDTIL